MATDTLPTLYQAITQSYRVRQILHAARGRDADKTLCGRTIVQGSRKKFDPEIEGACQRCLDSIRVMERAHPGWE